MTQAVMTRSPFAAFLASLFGRVPANQTRQREALLARGRHLAGLIAEYRPQADKAERTKDSDWIMGIAGAMVKYVEGGLEQLRADARQAGMVDIAHAADNALFELAPVWSVGDEISAEEAIYGQLVSIALEEAVTLLRFGIGRLPATAADRAEFTMLGDSIARMLVASATMPDAKWKHEANRVAMKPVQNLYRRHAATLANPAMRVISDDVLMPLADAVGGLFQGTVTRAACEAALGKAAEVLTVLGAGK